MFEGATHQKKQWSFMAKAVLHIYVTTWQPIISGASVFLQRISTRHKGNINIPFTVEDHEVFLSYASPAIAGAFSSRSSATCRRHLECPGILKNHKDAVPVEETAVLQKPPSSCNNCKTHQSADSCLETALGDKLPEPVGSKQTCK